MLLKTRNDGKGFISIKRTISKSIIFTIVIAILLIFFINILRVASISYGGCGGGEPKSIARGIAGAISGTIAASHAEFLLNGIPYNASSLIAETTFPSGVAVPTVDGDTITWVSDTDTFTWTYNANNGDASAYLSEDSSSAFRLPEPPPWYDRIFRL